LFDVLAIRLQNCVGCGAKLIRHADQGGVLPLSARSRENSRSRTGASSAAKNLVPEIVCIHTK
jgi:hypothetical protein